MRKRIIYVGTAFFILCALLEGCQSRGTAKKSKSIRTAVVGRGDIRIVLQEVGVIDPLYKAEVKSKVSGTITDIRVEEGQKVSTGDVLAVIEPDVGQANIISQIESTLRKAEVNVKQTEREFNRKKELFEEGLIAQDELEEAEENLSIARIEYSTALEQLKLLGAGGSASLYKVRAPTPGVIIEKRMEKGEMAIGTSSYTGGSILFVIGDLEQLVVKAEINEVDIGKIREGHPVEITVDAFPKELLNGEITMISPSARDKDGVKVFDIRIEIVSPNPLLKPGMTANIDISAEKRENVLVVPIESIFTRKEKDVVYARRNAEWVREEVAVGINDLDKVEIVSGLAEGDTIALENPF